MTTEHTTEGYPDWLLEMGERLRTQDNRITADPVFVVRDRRIEVVHEDFDHEGYWVVSEDWEYRTFFSLEEFDETKVGDEMMVYPVSRRRVPVQTFLTERAAQDFIARNSHRLDDPDIYAESLHRNTEMRQLRRWVMSLRRAED